LELAKRFTIKQLLFLVLALFPNIFSIPFWINSEMGIQLNKTMNLVDFGMGQPTVSPWFSMLKALKHLFERISVQEVFEALFCRSPSCSGYPPNPAQSFGHCTRAQDCIAPSTKIFMNTP